MQATPQSIDAEPLLRECDAAAFLRNSVRTLQAWRCSGAGPAFVRAGRSIRYRRVDLVAWIEKQRVVPQQGRSP
jgi:hypothetical protein